MATYTPGPWRWEDCGGYSRLIGANDGWVLDDGSAGGEYGAQIMPDSPDGWLVASAPDLLDACAEAHSVLDGLLNDDYRLPRAVVALVAKLDAAIAKAKGVQP